MSKPAVVAIIQARSGSTRLPGKVLAEIRGRPMLAWVAERAARARNVDRVVVATTTDPSDDAVAKLCSDRDIACFRGPVDDVLSRYIKAARAVGAKIVVRLTGDSPLIDPELIDRVVDAYLEAGCEYASNALQLTYPDGQDAEVVSLAALERSFAESDAPADREHVTRHIRMSGRFSTRNVASGLPARWRRLRLSVDEPVDLEFMRAVFARLGPDPAAASLETILELLEREPDLMAINEGVIRDRWYYESIASEPGTPARELDLTRSLALKARASRVIPSYTQTFSKNPTQFVQGASPVYIDRGKDSHVWDVDGNEYIDYILSLAPISLGHDYPAVTEAVTRQIRKGTIFSLAHPVELEVSELLVELIPCAEMVRFGKNGSDATSAAVRAARAVTGRDVVATCGYHGWQDWYIGTTTRNRGVPEAVRRLSATFVYNDISSLERVFAEHPGQVATVIMEPFFAELPKPGFLEDVRELTRREGAVLVFDEIVTGFRFAIAGAQEYFGVVPDMACFGKGMANGYPIAAVVGTRDVMEVFDEIFFSFTFGGEAASLAAAKATINEFRQKDVVGHLFEQGQKLMDGFNVLAEHFKLGDYMRCSGLAPRTVIAFRENPLVLKSLFQQECAARGILSAGYHNVCYTLTNQDVEKTLRAYRGVLEVMAQAIDSGEPGRYLKGEPVKPVFRAL